MHMVLWQNNDKLLIGMKYGKKVVATPYFKIVKHLNMEKHDQSEYVVILQRTI
jgi:hypothetical protein